jgi:hypothetical protein
MLGISGFGVALAYILCILSTILCIVYGIINWNKGGEDEPEQIEEEAKWEKKEEEVDAAL